jgi:hypothetical protein
MLACMRGLRREVLVMSIAIIVATAAGVVVAVGAVRPPAAMCITPYGNAVSAPGCDVNNVSATLAVVAGALTALVAGLLTLAGEVCAMTAWSRRHRQNPETGDDRAVSGSAAAR